MPCIFVSATPVKLAGVDKPGLANVAATVCNLLGYEAPEDYEPSLVEPA